MAKRSAADDTSTWIVTLAPGARIDQVSKALAAAGLSITSTLEAVGVVVGTAPKRALAALRKVRGVANVSPDRAVHVGPPDDSDTW